MLHRERHDVVIEQYRLVVVIHFVDWKEQTNRIPSSKQMDVIIKCRDLGSENVFYARPTSLRLGCAPAAHDTRAVSLDTPVGCEADRVGAVRRVEEVSADFLHPLHLPKKACGLSDHARAPEI